MKHLKKIIFSILFGGAFISCDEPEKPSNAKHTGKNDDEIVAAQNDFLHELSHQSTPQKSSIPEAASLAKQNDKASQTVLQSSQPPAPEQEPVQNPTSDPPVTPQPVQAPTSNPTVTPLQKPKNSKQPVAISVRKERIAGANPGLKNLGNTCFCNATLQCLFTLFKSKLDVLENLKNPDEKISLLIKILQQMNDCEYDSLNHGDISDNVENLLKKCFSSWRYNQEDANEFLDKIFESFNLPQKDYGNINALIKGSERNPLEDKENTLEEVLEHMYKSRSWESLNAPDILKINLGRNQNGKKENKKITFEEDFTLKGAWRISGGGDLQYSLKTIIVHRGNVGGGHYWAYCKNEEGKWFKYNDSTVIGPLEFDDDFKKEVYGDGESDTSAAILVYKKISTPEPTASLGAVPHKTPVIRKPRAVIQVDER